MRLTIQIFECIFNWASYDVECAVSSGFDYIVTHNVKDFRRVEELSVRIATPAEILNLLRSKK